MRRAVIVLAMAAVGAVPANGTRVPDWLRALAHDDAAALGDANPRSVTYRVGSSRATFVLHGRFVCLRPRCPVIPHGPVHGPRTPPRGTVGTITVDMHSHAITGFALTYPFLQVGAGPPAPARSWINFAEAAPGRVAVFSGIRRRSSQLPSTSMFGIEFSGPARRIAVLYSGGHDHVLMVAPTRGGGFCTSLSGPYGGTGCPQITSKVRARGGVLEPGGIGDASGPILFDGYFTVAHAARLTYQDGSTRTIPFVWVSKPIDAGFFLYDLAGHRKPGHRPIALSLSDRRGKLLYSQRVPR